MEELALNKVSCQVLAMRDGGGASEGAAEALARSAWQIAALLCVGGHVLARNSVVAACELVDAIHLDMPTLSEVRLHRQGI